MIVLITEIDDNTSPSHWPARANRHVCSPLIGRSSVDPPCFHTCDACPRHAFSDMRRMSQTCVSRHATRVSDMRRMFPDMRFPTCDACPDSLRRSCACVRLLPVGIMGSRVPCGSMDSFGITDANSITFGLKIRQNRIVHTNIRNDPMFPTQTIQFIRLFISRLSSFQKSGSVWTDSKRRRIKSNLAFRQAL